MSLVVEDVEKGYNLGRKHERDTLKRLLERKIEQTGNYNNCALITQSTLLSLLREINEVKYA